MKIRCEGCLAFFCCFLFTTIFCIVMGIDNGKSLFFYLGAVPFIFSVISCFTAIRGH